MLNNDSVKPLPEIFIGSDEVARRVDNYISNKYPILQTAQKLKGQEKNETKSIWYSKEQVETWLNEMNLINATGMRAYFGAYGDNEGVAPGQLCLLMVLTRTSADGLSNQDVVYENEPDFELRKNAGVNSRSLDGATGDEEGNPRDFNYGSPCPPIC